MYLFIHSQRNYQSAMQIYSALNLTPIERLEKEWKSLPKKVQHMYARLNQLFDSSGNFKQYRETLAQAQAPAIPVLSLILSDLTLIEENKTSIKVKVDDATATGTPQEAPSSNLLSVNGSSNGKHRSSVTINDQQGSGNGDTQGESELVHFEKMSMIYNTLSHLKRCSQVPYPQYDEADEKAHNDKKVTRTKDELIKMLTDLPRLSENELYDLKNDTKKKVKDLQKALRAARKK